VSRHACPEGAVSTVERLAFEAKADFWLRGRPIAPVISGRRKWHHSWAAGWEECCDQPSPVAPSIPAADLIARFGPAPTGRLIRVNGEWA
jgi:hypothetical protein